MSSRISSQERETQIENLCTATDYHFVKWLTTYRNHKSKFICNCKIHGEWEVTVDHFCNSGSRCPECKQKGQKSKEYRQSQVENLCRNTQYSFVKWEGDFSTAHNSNMTMNCNFHGEWNIKLHQFVSRGRRCAKCARFGYNINKKGYLYLLRSETENTIKIGITNNLTQRITQLKNETPFDFRLINCFSCEDGKLVAQMEKVFQENFESKGLTGFSGATEWLIRDERIEHWFYFLTSAQDA